MNLEKKCHFAEWWSAKEQQRWAALQGNMKREPRVAAGLVRQGPHLPRHQMRLRTALFPKLGVSTAISHSEVTAAASLSRACTQAASPLGHGEESAEGSIAKKGHCRPIRVIRACCCLQNSDSLGSTSYIYRKVWGGRWKSPDVHSIDEVGRSNCCGSFGDTSRPLGSQVPGDTLSRVDTVRIFRMLQFGHKSIFQNELLLTEPFRKHTVT